MKDNQNQSSKNNSNRNNTKNANSSNKRKEPMKLWAGLGVAILIGIGAYFYNKPPESLSASSTPNQVAQGELLFKANCQSCHGADAKGENPTLSRGGTKPGGGYLAPALNGTGHAWHHADQMLFGIIKNGSVADDSPMIGFKDKLSDDEIVAVMQYFKSLWPEKIQTMHAMRDQ